MHFITRICDLNHKKRAGITADPLELLIFSEIYCGEGVTLVAEGCDSTHMI